MRPLAAPATERSAAPRPAAAFLYAVPIGALGGLIGLGGAEFRLPVLLGPLGYSARQAIPLNLAVSMVTLAASLCIRGRTLTLTPLLPFTAAIIALISGAVVAAFIGATLGSRLSKTHLERMIFFLLVGIGAALIIEGFLPQEGHRVAAAHCGVAPQCRDHVRPHDWPGEQLAGGCRGRTDYSYPGVCLRRGYQDRWHGQPAHQPAYGVRGYPALRQSAVPMQTARHSRRPCRRWVSARSLGHSIGGLLVGIIPASLLKIGLGIILIISAIRTFQHMRAA